jgi:hypothetical protein
MQNFSGDSLLGSFRPPLTNRLATKYYSANGLKDFNFIFPLNVTQ